MKGAKFVKALLSVIVLVWFGHSVANVAAQDPCQTGHAAPIDKPGWAQGRTVDVYIDPAITDQRRSAVETSFNNWSQNAGANGSGVTYHFVSNPLPLGTGYTVLNQQHDDVREYTETYPDGITTTTGAVTYLS